ncbi:hypothetical protein ISCGN_006830 [Ixodes scapularis]
MPNRLLYFFVQILLLPYETTIFRSGKDLHCKITVGSVREGVTMTKGNPSPFCNFMTVSPTLDYRISWGAGGPRGTSTSPSKAIEASRIGDLVIGQFGSSTDTMPNRLSYFFVQILLLPYETTIFRSGKDLHCKITVGSVREGVTMTKGNPSPFCNFMTVSPTLDYRISWGPGGPRGTSTSPSKAIEASRIGDLVIGQFGSSTDTMPNRLSYFFVQILLLPYETTIFRSGKDLHCKITVGSVREGVTMTKGNPSPFCNFMTVSPTLDYRISWGAGGPRGTSTSPSKAIDASRIGDLVIGQFGSSTDTMPNRLSYFFVQILLLPYETTIFRSGKDLHCKITVGSVREGVTMTKGNPSPFCNFMTVSPTLDYRISWSAGGPRGTSTSPSRAIEASRIGDLVIGQFGSSTDTMPNRLLYFFVQILLLPYETTIFRSGKDLHCKITVGSVRERVTMTKGNPSPFCNFMTVSPTLDYRISWGAGGPRGTSTSPSRAIEASRIGDLVIGQFGSSTDTMPNRLLYFFVQILLLPYETTIFRSRKDLHCKITVGSVHEGVTMTKGNPSPFCNFMTVSPTLDYRISWGAGGPRGTSTSPSRAIEASRIGDLVIGQFGSSTDTMPNRLLYFFVQILLLPYETTIFRSGKDLHCKITVGSVREGVTMTKENTSPFCNFMTVSPTLDYRISWGAGGPRGTSTSPSRAIEASRIGDLVIGQFGSSTDTMPNRLLYFFVQILLLPYETTIFRSGKDLHCKITVGSVHEGVTMTKGNPSPFCNFMTVSPTLDYRISWGAGGPRGTSTSPSRAIEASRIGDLVIGQFGSSTDTMPNRLLYFFVQDVLLQIKEDILDRISCTTTRAVLALDIKGAFDNVSHTLVFENLASTGCGPRMYDYVRDFLSNWMATIGIESIRTSTIPIPSKGNRQGSVLSPTFGRQDFLEEVIETVQNYLEAGNLQRAPDKSQLLLLRAGKPIPEEEEGGHPPHRDGGAKYTVDRLVKTTTQVMRMVRRITSHRHGLEESDLIRLTQPLVVSHIACANPYLNLTCCREELINMHLASQWEHLALTLSGRHAPSSLGIPIPASQCEAIQLLLALWDKIQVAPIPWKLNPSLHPGRWMAPGPLIPLGPVV